jgi:hypothetical protein
VRKFSSCDQNRPGLGDIKKNNGFQIPVEKTEAAT